MTSKCDHPFNDLMEARFEKIFRCHHPVCHNSSHRACRQNVNILCSMTEARVENNINMLSSSASWWQLIRMASKCYLPITRGQRWQALSSTSMWYHTVVLDGRRQSWYQNFNIAWTMLAAVMQDINVPSFRGPWSQPSSMASKCHHCVDIVGSRLAWHQRVTIAQNIMAAIKHDIHVFSSRGLWW